MLPAAGLGLAAAADPGHSVCLKIDCLSVCWLQPITEQQKLVALLQQLAQHQQPQGEPSVGLNATHHALASKVESADLLVD